MKVRYSPRALAQLEEIHAYITEDNPRAAAAVVRRVETIALLIGQHPALGRPSDLADVRAMSVRPYPYVIFYKVFEDRDQVRILRVRHTRRRE